MAAHRANNCPFPAAMRGRRWTRADGKRPVQVNGRPASSTDPATWATLADVQHGAGDGYGVMLGGGLGCYDLDSTDDATAREFVATIPETILYIERSLSGSGFHVFVSAPEGRGTRRGNIERYTRARFIRTTGNTVTW
ncbi:bifunctional DNA primase/polymerase [Kytococcus schroeteri]|uniref:bifunctional DNA primase/polymerase n=1 Tax=Kytococcus schroeteri TaxID=138300 RepID=UPI00192E1C07|nr:bifunctional DNA primase/polymerase [Kytococcus schroeteri]